MTAETLASDTHVRTGLGFDIASPGGHYAHAKVHGTTVYVSGQLGIRPDGSHTCKASFEDQATQALSNLLNVLRLAGCGPNDIVKVTAYVVGVENWASFNQVYADLFGDAKPARTVVPVPALHYGYLVEVDAIAALRVDPASET